MSSIVGLEMPNAWRTGQAQDSDFDISANQLNVTANREMWVPSGSINWDTTLHTNALDPVSAQDLATKNYVDINGGALWSTFPATQNVDMASFQINDLADPTLDQDAATKFYVDNNAGATELDELTDVTIVTPLDTQFLQYNSTTSQWENVTFVPGTGPAIEAGDSSVTVIDSGVGRIESTVDGVLRTTLNATSYNITVPLSMNSQQINFLGTPADAADAATKDYVDTSITNANIPSVLDDLTDVTIVTPLVNQVLVNNGSGQWVNQAMTSSQLPATVAYTDVTNTFSVSQQFSAGLQLGADQILDMEGSNMVDTAYVVFDEQGSAPPDPALNDSTLYLADGSDFTANSPQPTFQVLIDRSGTIEAKPVVTSETVFALREFSNGVFVEETGVRLITDGGIGIRLQQFNENTPSGGYEVVLEGQIRLIGDPDISPSVGNTIDLTVGTDIAPTKHWVWTELVADVPTMISSTVGFPSTGDFAVIGTVILQSQASVLADGSYSDNFPDNEVFDDFARGHLAHLNDRITAIDSAYVDGIDITVAPTVGGGTAADVTYSSTVGRALELHLENIEAFDITTGIALVENEGTQTTDEVFRVANIGTDIVGLTCANGTTVIGNNSRVNLVVYTIHIDAEPNQTNYGINVPFDVYASDTDAVADVSGFSITSIPLRNRGTALLIAEIVVKITGAGATFEVLAVKDLRGQIPGSRTGGTSGGGGAGQLNDLSDVTIDTPLINQGLVYDGAGQWLNQLIPQLDTSNVWTDYQDYTTITDPTASAPGVVRFFTETIDVNNDALYCWLNQDGIMQKLRIA